MASPLSVSKIFSAELEGIDGRLIEVEVDIGVGLHSFNIVGLADKSLSEARERVNAALKNSGLKPPNRENRRLTVNLAPADIKKTGSQYDLAIALGYLLVSGQIKNFPSADRLFIGELSLDGRLRPVAGALPIAESAARRGFKYLFLPAQNAPEASLIKNITIIPLNSLTEVIDILEGRSSPRPVSFPPPSPSSYQVSISDIKGQDSAKRALLITAAGGHNLLMSGPPGSGKSMLAQALASIMPPLSEQEVVEITKVWSSSGLNRGRIISSRPFRSPHHTSSTAAIIGGGAIPRPGEISLAHRGILFLDEIPEFRRDVLEALRQPLETGSIFVSRVKGMLKFPARFTFVAAMNPCPCGYFGDDSHPCRCSINEIIRYQKKLSGPLRDRLDLQINVPRLKTEEIIHSSSSSSSSILENLRQRIRDARLLQRRRFTHFNLPLITNSELSSKQCDTLIHLDSESLSFVKSILDKSLISARGYYRLLKVARTIADLENEEQISPTHLKEAFQYRLKEIEF